MTPKLAVFYYCWMPDDYGLRIFLGQVAALRESGLEAAADELHVGLQGDLLAVSVVSSLLPRAWVDSDPDNSLGEAMTIQLIQKWLPGHEDWLVCYHHTKGVSHGANDVYANWRGCLQNFVIHGWRRCVADLVGGADTVGAHWHENLDQRYWAGNFWWATAKYLATLPPIDTKTVNGKSYESEVWIGKSSVSPRTVAYAGHGLMHCPPL